LIPPSLHETRFRLLWIGLLISITGTRMQTAAVLWHVSELSNQPISLGIIGLVNILPVLLFSLLAGAAADALNRRRLMFITQSGLACLALALGWLTLAGHDSLASIYAITGAMAAVGTFDLPARQSLVPNLVSPQLLTNAFSLTSIAFQLGSIFGPALAGLVLANLGIGYAYIINGVSFLAVIAALIAMGPVQQELHRPPVELALSRRFSDMRASVAEGLGFVMNHSIIFPSMLLDFFATFFSSATVLLPIFARDVLDVGVVGYGWLLAAPAVGAGAAALVLAFMPDLRRQGPILLISVTGFGLATVVFGVSRVFWLTSVALAITGVTDGVSTIIRNTIRQLQTPDRLRGRMTSVNQIFFMGGPQLGELEAGLVAQGFGAPIAVISGGLGCLAAVTWVAYRYPDLRRYFGYQPAPATQ
jgi:MFS family permease